MALNPNIPLQAKGANIVGNLRQGEQYGQQNRLAQLQIGQAEQQAGDRNKLRSLMPQAAQGNANAMRQVAGLDPQKARQIQEFTAKASEPERAAALERVQKTSSMFAQFMQLPQEQQAGAYQAARQQAIQMGGDASALPEQYDPQALQMRIAQARSVEDILGGGSGSYGKSLTPAYDAQGNLVFVQGSGSGGARVVDGVRPLGPEYKADEAQAVQTGRESTEGGQLTIEQRRAQVAESEQAAQQAEQDRARGERTRVQAVDLIDRILAPENSGALSRATGSIQGRMPSISQPVVDIENDMEALKSTLTTENLGLLSGVLSDTDIKLLQQVSTGGLELSSGEDRLRRTLERARTALNERGQGGGGQVGTIDAQAGQIVRDRRTGETFRVNDNGQLVRMRNGNAGR